MAAIDDLESKLTAVATAIRGKTGDEDLLTLDEMATEVDGLICPDMTQVTANAGNVLTGKKFYNAAGELTTGTMESTTDFSAVTADESSVLYGKVFYNSSGEQDTGEMKNNGAVSTTIDPGESYTIPAGYHSGDGTVTANEATEYHLYKSASEYSVISGGKAYGGSSSTTYEISKDLTSNIRAVMLYAYAWSSTSYPRLSSLIIDKNSGKGAAIYYTSSSTRVSEDLETLGISTTWSALSSGYKLTITFPATSWISSVGIEWIALNN